VEGISKTRFLPLFGGKRFDWLQVEVVIKVKVIEILAVNKKIEHIVALSANLKTSFYPV